MVLINVNLLLLLRIDYKLMARPAMYEMARDNKVHGTTVLRHATTRPTDLAIVPDGCLFVSDGYVHHKVHNYSPDGLLMKSWGRPRHETGAVQLKNKLEITATIKPTGPSPFIIVSQQAWLPAARGQPRWRALPCIVSI